MGARRLMRWTLSHRSDPRARVLADRHYNRQSIGADGFVPPGRCMVLLSTCARAFWVTSWPFAEYVKHAWGGAWICSAFRNEGAGLSSELIREAVAATCWRWPVPAQGMITFVDEDKVRHKRDPGRCYGKAGFHRPICLDCIGAAPIPLPRATCPTCRGSGLARTRGGLIVWQLLPADMPPPEMPTGAQAALAL